jgi:hypothetical protein
MAVWQNNDLLLFLLRVSQALALVALVFVTVALLVVSTVHAWPTHRRLVALHVRLCSLAVGLVSITKHRSSPDLICKLCLNIFLLLSHNNSSRLFCAFSLATSLFFFLQCLCNVFIVVVPLKQFLHWGSLQLALVLQHLLAIRIFPLLVRVRRVEIVFLGWRFEWRRNLLFIQLHPVKVLEPGVLLHLICAVISKSSLRLPLN